MSAEVQPLLQWPDPIFEFAGFLAVFLPAGALGYRFPVLRGLRRSSLPDERELAVRSSVRAAWYGLAGAALSVSLLAWRLPQMAADHHVTLAALLAHDPMLRIQSGLRVLALIGFVWALARGGWGWILAAIGVVVGPLRGVFLLQWSRLVNPIHELAGGLWIGTLFIVLAAGLPLAMLPTRTPERRAALTARLIQAFSPLALSATAVLAAFGVITAWVHLHRLSALWTTPYGITLIVKLAVVSVVVALGAWNWRRLKPRLGTEQGARALERSARFEVMAGAVVLLMTAVLVSLPSPPK
ncbi:MAG: CopD family protein [Candidatus Eiseniibacteriota bacterium]